MDLREWRHNIKTPVNAQKMALNELLTERPGPLSPIQRAFIEESLKSTDDLIERINDLFNQLDAQNQLQK